MSDLLQKGGSAQAHWYGQHQNPIDKTNSKQQRKVTHIPQISKSFKFNFYRTVCELIIFLILYMKKYKKYNRTGALFRR